MFTGRNTKTNSSSCCCAHSTVTQFRNSWVLSQTGQSASVIFGDRERAGGDRMEERPQQEKGKEGVPTRKKKTDSVISRKILGRRRGYRDWTVQVGIVKENAGMWERSWGPGRKQANRIESQDEPTERKEMEKGKQTEIKESYEVYIWMQIWDMKMPADYFPVKLK